MKSFYIYILTTGVAKINKCSWHANGIFIIQGKNKKLQKLKINIRKEHVC
jgi:hypothetical protein